MAVQRDRITVFPPEGETVTVDILEDDVSIGTAHAERTTTRELTLPLAISERTSFYVPQGGGPYVVSALLDGQEVAGDGVPVTVSSFPAEIRATVNVAEMGDLSSGSSQVPPPSVNRLLQIPAGGSGGEGIDSATATRLHWRSPIGDTNGLLDPPNPAALGFEVDVDGHLYVPADAAFVLTIRGTVTSTTLTSALLYVADGDPYLDTAPPLDIHDNGDGTFRVSGQLFGGIPPGWETGTDGGGKVQCDLVGTDITAYSFWMHVWSLGAS